MGNIALYKSQSLEWSRALIKRNGRYVLENVNARDVELLESWMRENRYTKVIRCPVRRAFAVKMQCHCILQISIKPHLAAFGNELQEVGI